jgi:hypothetical protein
MTTLAIAANDDDGGEGSDLLRMARQQLTLQRQTAQTLEVLLNNAERQEQKLKRLDATVARIERESGLKGSHWTVAAWIAHHGHAASVESLKNEGSILRGICLSHQFAIPPEKVCNGGNFPARQWPIEAMRIWWPGCCARHGWKLTWKV